MNLSNLTTATSGLFERAADWVARRARSRVPHQDNNRFLEGPYAPVSSEGTETDLRVTGVVPPELNGVYARIGPNPVKVPNPANYHWFLGDGMVHGIRLRDGKALWYCNRWIGSDSVNRELGRPLAPGRRHRNFDTVNTNVISHAGQVWALVEGSALPIALDRELKTIKHSFFDTELSRSFTAHPHRDPATGELHAICYDVMMHRQISYIVIGPDGKLVRDVAIPVRHGPMIHDSALTTKYVVILDLPVTFSMSSVLRGSNFPYQWNPHHPARIGLLPREGGADNIIWFEADPFYAFHTANAYDLDDGSVVLDLVAYPRMFDRSIQGPESTHTSFERFVLTPDKNKVVRTTLSDFSQEFPRCDERLIAQPYRFAYTVGAAVVPAEQPLYRHDLETGAIMRHDFGPQHLPGETIFVPRHAGAAETDGWLLTLVTDLADNSSVLTILDAQNLQGAPAATLHLPNRVPLGFHGNWIPDEF